MGDAPDDDPIASALLSEDDERRLRVRRWTPLGRHSPAQKLLIIGGTAAGSAALVVLVATLHAAALRQALGVADPLSASVAASVVLAVGFKYLTIGGVGLVVVGHLRRQPRAENRAERLLALEETMGIIGIALGGLGTVVGVALLVLLALADPAFVSAWLDGAASSLPLPVSYRVLVVWGAVLGVCLFVASFAAETTE